MSNACQCLIHDLTQHRYCTDECTRGKYSEKVCECADWQREMSVHDILDDIDYGSRSTVLAARTIQSLLLGRLMEF